MSLFKKNDKPKKDKAKYIDVEVERLIEWDEPNGTGCIVSNRITQKGYKVGYMYRDEPNPNYPDSGWKFMAGNEDDDYMNDTGNFAVFAINTVCNYDRDIIPYLHAPIGTHFIRVPGGKFEEDDGSRQISIEKQQR